MRFSQAILSLLLAAVPAYASFQKDVLRGANQKRKLQQNGRQVQSSLLSKATLLKEGQKIDATLVRHLEGDGDDFTFNYDDVYSFSGYSMKYAKCQPIQYFSENAVNAGEHSPMVTQDVVILRLCPQKSCSSDSTYGCYYNYAEYAIALTDYIEVMLRFSAASRDYTCDYCVECLGDQRRKLEENQNEDGGENQDNGEENQDNGEENQDQQDNNENQDQQDNNENQDQQQGDDAAAAGDDAAAAGDDAAAAADDDYNPYANACNAWDTYCSDYENLCADNGDDYLDYEGYLDYLDCAQVEYNDYAYFVRPRCDGYSGTIKMAVYYDNYCIQYAGNDVSIKDLGLGFKESMFQDFYSSSCIDCSDSVSTYSFFAFLFGLPLTLLIRPTGLPTF
jgi:hypothetical protein